MNRVIGKGRSFGGSRAAGSFRRRSRLPFRLAAFGVLVLSTGCTPLDDAMVAVFGRSMRDQPSFDPYENPINAPEGSVPFAAGNLVARAGEVNVGQPEGLVDVPPPFTQLDVLNQAPAVVDLENPVPVSEESITRGEELFLRFCAPCHGPNAMGVTGYIISAGYPPYPLISDRVRGFTDGYIYGMIRMGRGLMPGYGHRISHFDRWNVVNYLRILQGVVPSPTPMADPSGSPAPATEGDVDQDHDMTDQTEGAPATPGATSY